MNPPHIPRALWLGVILLALAGCASDRALREGERLIAEGQTEAGLKHLEAAMAEYPDEYRFRTAYIRQRERHIARLLTQADEALGKGGLDAAQALYRQVLGLHPENPRAPAGLAAVEIARGNRVLLAEAEAAFNRNEPDTARARLRAILAQSPAHGPAQALLKRIEARATRPSGIEPPRLAETFNKAINLEFRDAPLKSVFDAVSRQSGLNFVFDKDVRGEQKTTLSARGASIADALDMILAGAGLEKKVINGNTVMVYPNIPAKQKDYQEVAVRAFFLANADAKQVMTLLKTIAKIRDVHVDENLNAVIVRDTPEAIRLAEKLVALSDRQEPEVMLEVEILEVSRSKLMELGLQWPTQFSVLAKREVQAQTTSDGGVATNTQFIDVPMSLDLLSRIRGSTVGISPTPGAIANKTDGDVNILANPRIRVKNKEKAKIHIGDKVPVITSNVTSTGVTSESVSYLDVGLKLDVEPRVHLDGDVAMKVGLEVSNIVQQVKTATGTLTYQLGSRNATTALRLKDGETQVLAGLISDQDRASASKVPGLGDLPLLGRLFSSHRDEGNKTEIVLLITPRILRQVERPELAESEFLAGTEATQTYQPLRLRPAAGLPGRAPLEAEQAPPPAEEQPPEAPPVEAAPVAPIIRPAP